MLSWLALLIYWNCKRRINNEKRTKLFENTSCGKSSLSILQWKKHYIYLWLQSYMFLIYPQIVCTYNFTSIHKCDNDHNIKLWDNIYLCEELLTISQIAHYNNKTVLLFFLSLFPFSTNYLPSIKNAMQGCNVKQL